MVVESVIDQLDLPATRTAQAAASRPELERMAEEAGLMTAERVYAALRLSLIHIYCGLLVSSAGGRSGSPCPT